VHHWVLPYLPQSASAVKVEAALLAPAIHAVLNVAVLKLAYPALLKEVGMGEPMLIGVGAEIVGDYGFTHFIKTMSWMK
jgi:hypothetical protein